MSALVRGSQCLQSTRNTSLDPLDDTRSHVTVTRYILHYSVTLVLRLARLSIPGRLAEVSLSRDIMTRPMKTRSVTRSRSIGGVKRFNNMNCVPLCPIAQMGSGFFSRVKHLHPSSLTFLASFCLRLMGRAGNWFKPCMLACIFLYSPDSAPCLTCNQCCSKEARWHCTHNQIEIPTRRHESMLQKD